MQLKNSSTHFGLIAILFHWVMALIIIGMLAVGLYMTDLPAGLQTFKLYGWHKEFGILILMLASMRIIWRLINITPTLSLPWFERFIARAVHWIFYLFMFAMPITGWLMSSAAGMPVSFFGFVLPNLVKPDKHLMEIVAQVHQWLAFGLIAFIILHVLATLKHHFINKNNILRRISFPN